MASPETHRTIVRFAWLPARLDSGKWVWLRRFHAEQVWQDDVGGWPTGWIDVARF